MLTAGSVGLELTVCKQYKAFLRSFPAGGLIGVGQGLFSKMRQMKHRKSVSRPVSFLQNQGFYEKGKIMSLSQKLWADFEFYLNHSRKVFGQPTRRSSANGAPQFVHLSTKSQNGSGPNGQRIIAVHNPQKAIQSNATRTGFIKMRIARS